LTIHVKECPLPHCESQVFIALVVSSGNYPLRRAETLDGSD